MQYLTFVTALLAALMPIALAVPGPEPASSALDGLTKRRAQDTCAYVNENDPQLGQLRSCFCFSGVASYIDFRFASQPNRQRRVLKTRLRQLIASNGGNCVYPQFSTAFCTQGMPCLFVCSRGYTANQETRTCDCTGRNRIECNNRCRVGTACVSGVVVTKREKRETSPCNVGETQCGVRSSRGALSPGWECLDTKSSLESCGGCAISYGNGVATGRDCSSIKGVSGVSCVQGSCRVHSCRVGYRVADNGSDCVEIIAFRQQQIPSLLS
ncbi:hypothetical protein HGRIS_010653 [Hohenbuehelia grisea]|uniref:Protein CPL1-like domain-containing protein n=1 Tax=Hohenbuehelia grisea TaxID=104357 RepID=A0ABR3IXN8_9AGAR